MRRMITTKQQEFVEQLDEKLVIGPNGVGEAAPQNVPQEKTAALDDSSTIALYGANVPARQKIFVKVKCMNVDKENVEINTIFEFPYVYGEDGKWHLSQFSLPSVVWMANWGSYVTWFLRNDETDLYIFGNYAGSSYDNFASVVDGKALVMVIC